MALVFIFTVIFFFDFFLSILLILLFAVVWRYALTLLPFGLFLYFFALILPFLDSTHPFFTVHSHQNHLYFADIIPQMVLSVVLSHFCHVAQTLLLNCSEFLLQINVVFQNERHRYFSFFELFFKYHCEKISS